MFCPKCGASNDEQANFCRSCGFNIKSITIEPPKTTPPQSNITPPAVAPAAPLPPQAPVQYAGFWPRLGARLIDSIIIVLLGFLIGIASAGIGAVFGFLIDWLYYAVMESSYRQGTLGKIALGLKVTDLNGKQISFGRATARYFADWLNGFTGGLSYLVIAFSSKKQGLHDMIAGTLVVRK